MKKKLSIILFLFMFCLISCSNPNKANDKNLEISNEFIKVAKVDITRNLQSNNNSFQIYLFTSSNIKNIELMPSFKIIESKVERYDDIIIKEANSKIEGYLYIIDIKHKKEAFVMNNITIKYNNTTKEIDIGRYQSVTDIQEENNILVNVYKELTTEGCYDLSILVHNKINRDIYLQNISTYQKPAHHYVNIKTSTIPSSCVYSGGVGTYNNIDLEISSPFYIIEGIIVLHYLTNLTSKDVFASYYVNRMSSINYLREVGININDLS